MNATITCVESLPFGPYNGSGKAGIIITNGCPSYFKVTGVNLDLIIDFDWYPRNPGTIEFKTRGMILVDNCLGTCMVMVIDNQYSTVDRGGHLSFRLIDDTVITVPVVTYGQLGHLWTSPYQGIDTG